MFKVLQDFLSYLDQLDDMKISASKKFTTSSITGLRITVKTALELVEYLSHEVGFKYFLTRRMNQDTLEVIINIKYKINLDNIIARNLHYYK